MVLYELSAVPIFKIGQSPGDLSVRPFHIDYFTATISQITGTKWSGQGVSEVQNTQSAQNPVMAACHHLTTLKLPYTVVPDL
jgi:hypothetical protein